ncbi:MAG TPA: bifunctional oligoribonuclease/PAP phosphatase NrnA [Pseudogracilibacillus sp.]|nr:bifunctional oligoribonuclease/PAP phosphatase NrnA [Pseudogracilibacillus sp.]
MSKQEIIEAIKENDKIIIHRHVRPDPDALGSQCGLREMIVHTFPEKQVFVVGEEDEALHFLVRMDEIADDAFDDALVIVCDTANTGRISDQRYKLGKKVIKIDHHPNIDPYGDILWVDTDASSTSEMIYELYLEAEDMWQMNDAAARLIYAGIVGDTGRFLFPSTNRKTFRYAADLIEYDFDRTALYDGLYDVDLDIARLRGYILQNLSISDTGMSAIKLTKETLAAYNVEAIDTGRLVGAPGDVKGVLAWVFFIEEDDKIRVRLRSKGPQIHKLAERNNGGGHPLASGATVYSWQEAEKLQEELDEICATYEK